MKKNYWLLYLFLIGLSCNQPPRYSTNSTASVSQKEDVISCPPGASLSEMQTIVQNAGKSGHSTIAIPENELNIIIDGFKIFPVSGLGNWAAFAPSPDNARIIGDIITTESYLPLIQQELNRLGFSIADIHKHSNLNRTVIVFMHIIGSGDVDRLSTNADALFSKLQEINGEDQQERTSITNLDISSLDSIIGYKGEIEGNIYKYTIGRPDVLKAYGISVSGYLGFNTWGAWQGTNERAIVAGDFTMLRNEIGPVLKALAEHGFEGVTVHNHLLHEEPEIFILHYWGVGNAEKLAKGLRAALKEQEGNESSDF
jgi:hypothetical protein